MLQFHNSVDCPWCQDGHNVHCPMDTYPDAHVWVDDPRWKVFCKRTEDPKLRWIEILLSQHKIPSRRKGISFHAPILEIRERDLDAAWKLLKPIYHIEDYDPMFLDMPGK